MDWPYQAQIVLWHILAAHLALITRRYNLLIFLLPLAMMNVFGFLTMGSSIWFQGISLAALILTIGLTFMKKKKSTTRGVNQNKNAQQSPGITGGTGNNTSRTVWNLK